MAVQEGLKYLTKIESDPTSEGPSDSQHAAEYSDELLDDEDYFLALRSDVVAAIRQFVTAVRSSGQRREQFDNILRDGNAAGGWGAPLKLLRPVGLKKDVITRWSSTYNMVDHFVELYLVSFFFLSR